MPGLSDMKLLVLACEGTADLNSRVQIGKGTTEQHGKISIPPEGDTFIKSLL